MKISCFIILLLTIFTQNVYALQINGQLKSESSYEWEAKEICHSQVSFYTELQKDFGWDKRVYLSLNSYYDILENNGNLSLDEAYLSLYYDNVDLTIGQQVINWGTADGINPTNYINPLKTGSLSIDSLNREPILTAQATYYGSEWFFTGVLVPFFTPQTIDSKMRDLFGESEEANLLLEAIDNTEIPERILENMEYAFRAETLLAGWDMQLSYYYGFSPLPAIKVVTVFNPITGRLHSNINSDYRREHKLGLATAGTIGKAGAWGEITYSSPDKLEDESSHPFEIINLLSINKPYLQAVVGADYTLNVGKGLYIQGQYIYQQNGSLINPYLSPEDDNHSGKYFSGRIAYDFDQSNNLEIISIHNIPDKNGVIMPRYTHRFAQNADLKASLMLNYGEGEFDAISNQVTAGITIYF